jgi:serine/threonine protein kinase
VDPTKHAAGAELETAIARRAIRQTLLCVEALHACGIVHCDVKASNMLICETTQELRLIDLGGAASCLFPPLLSYAPGEGVHDPLFSPPELNLLPEGAKAPTARTARGLWQTHAPYLYDMYSVGIVLLQLALPRLRSDAAIKAFRAQLEECGGDLLAWRAAKGTPADEAVLDEDGWDLAAGLMRTSRLASGKGKEAQPGRLSCKEALAHVWLKGHK